MNSTDANVPEATLTEVKTAPPAALTEVKTAPPTVPAKKVPAKNAAPSDRTIIQKLRAEAKAQDAKIKELEEALEIQQSKNIQVFNKYQDVAKELERQREKFSNSKSALLQTIDGALRAFTNI